MARKQWQEREFRMSPDHQWMGRPGCKILVVDRGAVRLDYPEEWHATPTDDCMQIHDKPPPNDNCRLAVSYMTLPPGDFSGLGVATLLDSSAGTDPRPISSRGDIQTENRGLMSIAWRENRFTDPTEHREACGLMCMARQGRIQALITFDFWFDDRERSMRIWTTVLKSLELDRRYADPFTGRRVR